MLLRVYAHSVRRSLEIILRGSGHFDWLLQALAVFVWKIVRDLVDVRHNLEMSLPVLLFVRDGLGRLVVGSGALLVSNLEPVGARSRQSMPYDRPLSNRGPLLRRHRILLGVDQVAPLEALVDLDLSLGLQLVHDAYGLGAKLLLTATLDRRLRCNLGARMVPPVHGLLLEPQIIQGGLDLPLDTVLRLLAIGIQPRLEHTIWLFSCPLVIYLEMLARLERLVDVLLILNDLLKLL
jgi:hypothetical protein